MAEGSQPDTSSDPNSPTTGKGTLTTAAVGISSLIVFLANHLEDSKAREVLTLLAPTIGAICTYLASVGSKQLYHYRGNKQLGRWISALLAERPHANHTRRKEIDAELAEYRARLKQRRLDNLP